MCYDKQVQYQNRRINMLTLLREFLSRIDQRQEKGQTLIEYALIIVLIVIGVIAAMQLLGPQIAAVYNTITDTLSGL